MLELIQTIALLCQTNVGGHYVGLNIAEKNQLTCQQNYIECIKINKHKLDNLPDRLYSCIVDRKLDYK